MRHTSVFNGIGGFQLAAEWMGWENIMSCEIDEFCNKITKYYWPNCKQYEDIRKTDFTFWRGKTDVLTGGFPCQPFSHAGSRKGTNDNRYLWPEMLRAIDQSQPTFIVGENVTGILSMEDQFGISKEVFPKMEGRTIVRYEEIDVYEALYTRQKKMLVSSICEDLERKGYEVQPMAIPAASVEAPHKRERIWFLAYRSGKRCNNGSSDRKERYLQDNSNGNAQKNKQTRNGWKCGTRQTRKDGVIANSFSKTFEGNLLNRQEKRKSRGRSGKGNVTHSISIRQGESNRIREAGFFDQKGEIPDWKDFPTQPAICDGNDGLSNRLDGITFSKWRRKSIEAGGNAIVPHVGYEIFKAIEALKTSLR